ncbi:MAG: Asp-tRNA(Asn)/Glu-tRNA(Gln) amidotransferase subunit GatB [Myxococcales bacterium]|nr:Asp-tRNA(Asn)/Glu-tRNA(Gln) amidotransferase subunit GatB [Myxococcales bacterium]
MVSAYEPVIGLEVHAQLLSASKLFSWASTAYGAPPNTHITPVCLGLPGALPVPNRHAVELAVRAAVALGLTVQLESRFDRKHYFYPDLPKGYQISQFDRPIALDGRIKVVTEGGEREIRIQRIHMEEDAAKNLHRSGGDTCIDFNRAGVPLIEIVTHPDLRSSEEAESYLRALREVLIYSGVNDGNLEEGSFRCDANVSIRPVGEETLGTRVELKNINSFRFVRKAIDFEIRRQEALVRDGGRVVQETRSWNENQGKTLSMRGKEEAHDYRYFPDPDLPPLILQEEEVADISAKVPELAAQKRERWQKDWGLTAYDAGVLTQHPFIARYFEEVVDATAAGADKGAAKVGKKVANFVQSEALRVVQTEGLGGQCPVSAPDLGELLALVERDTINGKIAKDVFAKMLAEGLRASDIVERDGLAQVVDTGAIEAQVREVVEAHPEQAEQFRSGKTSVIGFFVGRVMKASGGTANPKIVSELLRKVLGE